MKVILRPVSIEIKKGDFRTRRVPLSPNDRAHWTVRNKWTKAWKEEVGWALIAKGAKRIKGKLALTVHLYTCYPQDEDNATASVKAIIDGLKGGVIEDDSPNHLELKVLTHKVHLKNDEHVELELNPAS